ncbi:hypothetical protein TL16_g00317 [Triparma laevis f. inornata]|uniref:Uncharacterized protein n=1 Tax=Triparma laevis f. inornata TaxID=1714386 RepID=A0A9W6ZDR8_9STRA|nr:hypothetical protein TL16_g00317 [Triparma laevis f. inornata]
MPKSNDGGIGGAMNVNGYTILDDKNANILGLQGGQAANLASRIAPGKRLKSNVPKLKAAAKECPFKDKEICMVARRRILRVLEEVLSYNLFTEEKERTARRLEMYDACFELGRACNQARNHEEAAKYLKKARNGYEEELGRDSEKTLEVTLGYILCTTWNIDKDRVEKLTDLVKRAETSLGPEKVVTLGSLSQLGTCLHGNGNFKEAGKVWERCVKGGVKGRAKRVC